jgi:sulfite oxidase
MVAFAFASGSSLVAGLSILSFGHGRDLSPPDHLPASDPTLLSQSDGRDPSIPRFRLSEIRTHDAKSGSPWVTHEDKVYDITDWVAAHPGGDVILRAAGGSIDPYWNIFTIHKTPYIYEILDQYKIGFIDAADLVDGKPAAQEIEDPFQDDPSRDPKLITITPKPRNAETPPEGLADSFLTPNGLFYVRNHMWVPRVDDEEFCLVVELLDGTTREYTMDELQSKFRRTKITATLQCSGNRRKDMTTHARETKGLQWNVGAISCAEWEGVRLADVLADAGFPVRQGIEGDTEAKHVQFSGMEAYGASIPIQAALDPRGDVILAYAMNGEPLPRDHGFPLRAIVPGHVAARSVKWLSRITISDEESHSQWQRKDYKCFGPNESNPDWEKAPAIQEMPVNSAITTVQLDSGMARVQGYAYSGGGRSIIRVDISLDNGKTWDQARLLNDKPIGRKSWAWRRWQYEGAISLAQAGENNQKCSTILVKATDDAYNSQPESHKGIYNARGNLANAWHRLKVCSECT